MFRFTLFDPPSPRASGRRPALAVTFLAVVLLLLGGRTYGAEQPERDRAARAALALAEGGKASDTRERTARAALALTEAAKPPVVAPAPRAKVGVCPCGATSDLVKVRDALVRVWCRPKQGDKAYTGSGTVVWSGGGRSVVLTAAHVVEDGGELTVRGGGKTHAAELLAADPTQDLAALLVGAELPAVAVSASEPKEGEEVLMMGVTSLWSRGTVGQELTIKGQDVWTLEYDSDHGDSGGGVFHEGKLIGVHCGKCGDTQATATVPYCTRAKPIRSFLAKVLKRDGAKTVPVGPPAAPKVAAPKADEYDTWLINGQFIRVPKGQKPPACPNGRCPLQR